MDQIITSTQNAFVKTAKSLKTKKGREKTDSFLVEGEKCVGELLDYMPAMLQSLIVTDGCFEQTAKRVQKMGRDVYQVSPHVMDTICDCKTPQGIAAVAKIPKQEVAAIGLLIALDGLQDPQNIGTIIRTADAAGCAGVVLSHGSADCFGPKAVRASMGSLFHLPVGYADLESFAAGLLPLGYHVACADLSGDEEFSLSPQNTCLVIGNESRGVSAKLLGIATHRIRIPMWGRAESLNAAVAAGILLYRIRRDIM